VIEVESLHGLTLILSARTKPVHGGESGAARQAIAL
jgi:hypothetical protein